MISFKNKKNALAVFALAAGLAVPFRNQFPFVADPTQPLPAGQKPGRPHAAVNAG